MSKIRRYRGADSETQESITECRQAHVAPPIHRPGRHPVHGHHLHHPLIRKFLLTLFSLGTRTEFYWYFGQLQKYDFGHLRILSLTILSARISCDCVFDTMFTFVRLYTFCCVFLLS